MRPLRARVADVDDLCSECDEPEPTSEVKATLARFLLARNARHREELEKERHQALKDLGLSQAEIGEAWEGEKTAIASEMFLISRSGG